jgi:hypothetical protein
MMSDLAKVFTVNPLCVDYRETGGGSGGDVVAFLSESPHLDHSF